MHIDILDLIEGAKQARGLTVIIDVFRAFSTACYVVRNGARQIIPVGDVDLAYKLREENPDYILMGERKGKMLAGFDYGNSPADIQNVDFSGKTEHQIVIVRHRVGRGGEAGKIEGSIVGLQAGGSGQDRGSIAGTPCGSCKDTIRLAQIVGCHCARHRLPCIPILRTKIHRIRGGP